MWGGLGLTDLHKDEDWENAKKIYLMDNELSVLPKNPRCHVLSTVKVSHIAKRSLSCRLYKPWTPLLSQGVF
jgi:hypothetical protein